MKIKILLVVVLSTTASAFMLAILAILIENFFSLEMNNFIFVSILSFMLFWYQILWIKAEPSGWFKFIEKYFGVKISTD